MHLAFKVLFILVAYIWEFKTNSETQFPLINCTKYIDYERINIGQIVHSNMSIDCLTDRLFLEPYIIKCLLSQSNLKTELPKIAGFPFGTMWINFSVSIENIISFESNGILTIPIEVTLFWIDENIHYFIETPNDLTLCLPSLIRIPANEIWTPNFFLQRCESQECWIKPDENTMVFLINQSYNYYFIIKNFRTSCDLSLEDFPFDEQICWLKFYKYQYSANELIIQKSPISYDIPRIENEELSVLDLYSEPWNYTFLTLNSESSKVEEGSPGFLIRIVLRRVPHFYVFNIIVPSLLISTVGFLSVLLRSDSSDKLNLAVTVLLGYLFIQAIIATLIPKSSSVPNIAYYLLFSLILSAYNASGTAILLYIYNRKPEKMPKIFCLIGIRILGILVLHRVKGNLIALKNSLSCPKSKNEMKRNKILIDSTETVEIQNAAKSRSRIKSCTVSWQELSAHLNILLSPVYFVASIAVFSIFILPLIKTAYLETIFRHHGKF